ncbi:helix-turn-helix domain-containing protein [Myxococcus sp. Y35]|uniref:AraC family transcriptional regulator n=1 Tax=Pseudomyxococcus flavus TaxID=3115648 RepID=UPI003CF4574E
MARLNESRMGAVLTEAFAVRASTSTHATPHAQHGAAILIGLDADVELTEATGTRVHGRVVVVPPHLTHAVASPGPTLGLLFDPERMPRAAAYSRARGGAFPMEGALSSRLHGALLAHRASLANPAVLDGLARELAHWLPRDTVPAPIDGRVARVLEALRDPCEDSREVIARLRISPAHLQALFVRDVGMPIRTYRLWRRLLAAVASLRPDGATEAAHAVGFADLAHFSRTCRRMLGYSPTGLSGQLMRT